MELRRILMEALRDSDPKRFNQMGRSGELEMWIQAKGKAARETYDQQTKHAEKDARRTSARLAGSPNSGEVAIAQALEGVTSDES